MHGNRPSSNNPLRWYVIPSSPHPRPAQPCPLVGRVGSILLLATLLLPTAPAAATGPIFTRVAILPVGSRTTIAVELSGPVEQVTEIRAAPNELIVEAGPIGAELPVRDLTPSGGGMALASLRVHDAIRENGSRFLRLEVKLRTAAVHRLRHTGMRIYVDLTPEPATVRAAEPGQTASIEPKPLTKAAPKAESPSTRESRATPPKAAPAATEPLPTRPRQLDDTPANGEARIEQAYAVLQKSALDRARDLAARPDVKGLLRLQQQVKERDTKLGKARVELIRELLEALEKFTDNARSLQLERDRANLLKPQ
jgi:hypothetical protein